MKTIYLAAGCFWGVEAFFKRIDGVMSTEVGYANGNGKAVTYDDVVTGQTGYTETCKVDYDPSKVSLTTLLEKYWTIIDPTSLNKQGNDRGTQYRTGIYFIDTHDIPIIEASLKKEQENHLNPIVTEVKPLESYYSAETYHQDYLTKNPGGYCHIRL